LSSRVLIVIIVGNGHVIVLVALGKGLLGAIIANSVFVIVVGNVALLGILNFSESHFGVLNKPDPS
jgi:hypothetical protein